MDWFTGDVAQCIKKVKSEKKLFLVFSRDDENNSEQVSEALDSAAVVGHFKSIICLQLRLGSLAFRQFCAIYAVPTVPCIHVISPFGEILSVKSTDFSQEHILVWIQEVIGAFNKTEKTEIEGSFIESDKKSDDRQASESIAKYVGDEVSKISGKETSAQFCNLSEPGESGEAEGSISVEVEAGRSHPHPEDGMKDQQAEEVSTGASLDEKIELARRILEEKRREKVFKSLQETHESELRRRDLGRNLAEFKRLKHEQEIRERLEEQKREKAERHEARNRILAQIELDRRERMAVSSSKTSVSNTVTSSKKSPTLDSDKVRLQIRLPDGAHMVGVFSAEANLGTDVRQYISARVQGVEFSSECGATIAPLNDEMLSSFAAVVSSGYTFRQTRPNPPRHFSSDDESTKTLLDLGLWPSAVLTLYTGSTSCSNPSGSGARSVTEYSQNVVSYLFGRVWTGIRGAERAIYGLGNGLIHLGQSAWQALFGGVGSGGRTVGGAPVGAAAPMPDTRQSHLRLHDEDSAGRNSYRRQGKISRLSHMPDDTDEQARWNGNSTTQL